MRVLLLILVAQVLVLPASSQDFQSKFLSAGDDECEASDSQGCALQALQRRSSKVTSSGAAAAPDASATALELAEFAESVANAASHNNAALAELGVHFNASGMAYDLMAMGPPPSPLAYDGMAWPQMVVTGAGPHHVFAIGDWGGMDGSFDPGNGHARIIAYRGGHLPGPHVFPRTRFNKPHTQELCNHKEFVECYATNGIICPYRCGYVRGVDDEAQLLVARAFNQRAGLVSPRFILNVGDNFYWGGLEVDCGTPMGASTLAQKHQFDTVFEGVYSGAAPWLSALGNHDWGGFKFTNGWDQQIAYTWKSGRWVMPASYFSQHVDFPDAGFSVDVYILESNKEDAKSTGSDPDHNICSSLHNYDGASCPDGPSSVDACPSWFHGHWAAQELWLTQQLAKSTANWQIVVTHFPCGVDAAFYKQMHRQYGLDLLVTGHRHDQELWSPNRLGGLTCFVTGGGGGISSEATPNPWDKSQWYGEAQYGFYDLTITKDLIIIESINFDGSIMKKAMVYPKEPGQPQDSSKLTPGLGSNCSSMGCDGAYVPGSPCQCTSRCTHYGNCCADYGSACTKPHDADQPNATEPETKPQPPTCARFGCGRYVRGQACQCNVRCHQFSNCCKDYAGTCSH